MVNKLRLYWTLQTGGWLLYALVQILISAAVSIHVSFQHIVFLVYEAIICLLITHLFRHLINTQKWLQLSLARLIPLVLFSVLVLGLCVYFLRMPANFLLDFPDEPVAVDVRQMVGLTSIYGLIFFVWSVLYFTYHYFERYNESLKYRASMIEIELNNLKSQINPHFIFNALNSIRALVDENPVKSRQAINQLSNILRSSLITDKKRLTSFDDELKTVKDYLGLESIRFEERLKVEYKIHPDSKNFLVPPLMIQTLVENGIKHGISKLTEGGKIQVETSVENRFLKIQIRNSGHINDAIKNDRGIGMKNTIQRLNLIYGGEAKFSVENENDDYVLTQITIPEINNL